MSLHRLSSADGGPSTSTGIHRGHLAQGLQWRLYGAARALILLGPAHLHGANRRPLFRA
uniref:Uncharacterized protein n=1 Tax=uncultured marine virus TaxID=186617 RepID=A0A0F7L4M9_9VIRU|nr:hypothetical protein [uncultured marine virus]